jgi:hypothetical protein
VKHRASLTLASVRFLSIAAKRLSQRGRQRGILNITETGITLFLSSLQPLERLILLAASRMRVSCAEIIPHFGQGSVDFPSL